MEIDKIIAELKKSAPIGLVVCLCLAGFGCLISFDLPHGINKAFLPWITYSLMIGGPIGAIGCLVIFVGQHAAAFLAKRDKAKAINQKQQHERVKVFDHVHHLDGIQLVIMLGFLRSRNGRGEQITYSKKLDQMRDYNVLVEENGLHHGPGGARTLIVHPELMKDRKNQDRIISEILKEKFKTTFDDNVQLKEKVESIEERSDYQSHYGRKIVRLPTLF